jgi:type IV pilus assembly protein PilE
MKHSKGFSLIELMIAVAVIGILTMIAIPSYQSFVVRGNRAAAQAFMVDVASRQKQYLIDARAYAADLATLGVVAPTDVSRHYTSITFAVSSTPPTFTLTATPTSNQQAADGALTLTNDGAKGPSGKW